MVKIKLAELKDSNNITNLLNKVTSYLHESNINQWVYPWNSEEIKKDILKRYVYIVVLDGAIIGTFSIMDTDKIKILIIKAGNKYLYRIAVLPEYQGRGIGTKITAFALEYSRSMNKLLFLDCWSENEKLKSFYSSNGFDLIEDAKEEDYFVSVFKSKEV